MGRIESVYRDLVKARRDNAELLKTVTRLELELSGLKREIRAHYRTHVDALPVQRNFCDNCIHWDASKAKCFLGYTKRFFFKVPVGYNFDDSGWFRRPNCKEYHSEDHR